MDLLSRRRFLVASGVAGAALAGAGAVTWRTLWDAAGSSPKPVGERTLVLVTLYGGNDGLNTVVPYADPAYRQARPELAYDAADVLHLDDRFGLNPAMTGLAALWKQRQLAVVLGAGYPRPDHSHFRSMDIWQTASPQAPVTTGWIGRWLDATGDDPLRAVSLGSVLPPLAVGERATAAALPLSRDQVSDPAVRDGVLALGPPDPRDTRVRSLVRASYRAQRLVDATFAGVVSPSPTGEPDTETAAGSGGGQTGLSAQLDAVARSIAAGVPTRAYSVSLGGFDTHAGERAAQESQLGQLDRAVSGFLETMAGDPRGRDVVLMIYSEFGRRVAANASQGTDHGTAAPVLVAGPPVTGGFYGEPPSLTDLDDGDLKFSTDFRTIYAELLSGVLGADPVRILGDAGRQPPLGFLA